MHSQELKQQARTLRILGYSLKDIAHELSIAKSTASKWVIDIELGPAAKEKIYRKQERGRRNSFSTSQLRRQKVYNTIASIITEQLIELQLDKLSARLLCSFLYWGEGSKRQSCVKFTNSDPVLVATFLSLFRSSFKIYETKFSATLHLHDYHDRKKQLQFWSKITKIPEYKIGIYNKPHTGINKRPGYPGCISVNYYDVRLFKALTAYYTILAKRLGA